jgi:O-antigen/teichoic acid export membrane protein
LAIEKNRPSRFARNAVANWIVFFFIALVSFFLSPYVVHNLGAEKFGVWTVLGGLLGYLGLLDFGIRTAVSRYIAHDQAASAHEECSSTTSAALRLIGLLGIGAVLVSMVFAFFAPLFFNIPDALVNDTRIIIVVGGLTVALSLTGGIFGGVVTGLQRFDISGVVEILVTVVRTAAFVLALREGYGLVALAAIQLAASALNFVLFVAAAHRLYPELKIRLRGSMLPHIRKLVSFGMSMTAVYALGQLIYYSHALVIGALLPIEAVTFFAIAGSLCVQVRGVASSLAYLMTPRVSALTSIGSSRVGEEILTVAGFATVVAAPIAAIFWLRGESFITLWMGPEYGPISGQVLRILAAVVWLEASRSVVMHSFIGMAKQRTLIPGLSVEAASNLALSIALVGPLGVVGVAYGTLVPFVLVSLWYFPWRLWVEIKVPFALYYRKALLLPTLACVPFALASAAMEWFIPASNLAVFFVQVLLVLPLVPVAAWFLCLTAVERKQAGSRIWKSV